MNRSLWYVGPGHTISEVRHKEVSGFDNADVDVIAWQSSSPYRVNFTTPFPYPWSERETQAFQGEVSRRLAGAARLNAVKDLPFFVHSGPLRGEEEGETRVWLQGSRDLDQPSFKDAKQHGRVVPLGELAIGSFIIDTGARLLIEYVYGALCVDRDGDVFLGKWHEAAEHHAENVRALMKTKPGRFDGDVGDALSSYLDSKRISDMQCHLRIAFMLYDRAGEAVDYVREHWRIEREHPRLQELLSELLEDLRALSRDQSSDSK